MELEELRPDDIYNIKPGFFDAMKDLRLNRSSLQMEIAMNGMDKNLITDKYKE